jgi:pilus assembly protein Flp/PilA
MTRRTRFASRSTDEGASAVEYGLLVVSVAAVIVALVFALGTWVSGTYQDTCAQIDASGSGIDPAGDC